MYITAHGESEKKMMIVGLIIYYHDDQNYHEYKNYYDDQNYYEDHDYHDENYYKDLNDHDNGFQSIL